VLDKARPGPFVREHFDVPVLAEMPEPLVVLVRIARERPVKLQVDAPGEGLASHERRIRNAERPGVRVALRSAAVATPRC
jgi:hypothetical protein